MARLLIYDAYENKVYTYANLNENDPMPYSTLTTLRLREFRGKSASPTLWTTIAAMEAWNLTRRKYGRGIPVGYAFRRIWEGGHGTRSQHYAGVAFDVGQSLGQRQRTAIYNAARATGAWGYVEPLSQTAATALRPAAAPPPVTPPCAGAAGAAMSWSCRTHFPPLATRPAAVSTASLVPAPSRRCAATRSAPACGWTACAAATAGKRSPPPSSASGAPKPPLTSVCPIQKKRPHKAMCGRSFSLILQPVSAVPDLRHPGGRAPCRSFRSGRPDWGCAKA